MTENKRMALLSVTGLIIFLMGGYIILDWYSYFTGTLNVDHPDIMLTNILKYLAVLLSALIVALTGKESFDRKDLFRLYFIYAFIVLGDTFFLLKITYPAIGCFVIAHIQYIFRHLTGMKKYMRQKGDTAGRVRYNIVSGAGILLFIIVFLAVFFIQPLLSTPVLLIIVTVYGLVLGASLWAGLAAYRIGYFPKPNAMLIILGLSAFFVTDLIVGFSVMYPPGNTRLLAAISTFVIYTPALVLPAFSNYRIAGPKPQKQEKTADRTGKKK